MSSTFRYLAVLLLALALAFAVACGGGGDDDDASDDDLPSDDDNDTDDDDTHGGTDDDTADDDTLVEDPSILDNGLLRVTLDDETGHILDVLDLRKDIRLLDSGLPRDDLAPLGVIRYFGTRFGGATSLHSAREMAGKVRLQSLTDATAQARRDDPSVAQRTRVVFKESLVGSTVTVDLTLREGEPTLFLDATVVHDADLATGVSGVVALEYPVLYGVRSMGGDRRNDRMAVPIESGLEIDDPLSYINALEENAENEFADLQYPDGHSLTLPLLALYSTDSDGGFVLYADDSTWMERRFHLEGLQPAGNAFHINALTVRNFTEDMQLVPGATALTFGLRLTALDHGDWAAAMDVYRDARESANGEDDSVPFGPRLADRSDAERRIAEKMGVSVFGLSGRVDQSAWMDVFHRRFTGFVAGDGVLFTTSWDAHPSGDAFGGDLYAFYQAGWDADFWSPYVGAFETQAATARARGDLVFPFFYDTFVHSGFPDWNGFDKKVLFDPVSPWKEHVIVDTFGQPQPLNLDPAVVPGDVYHVCPADGPVREFNAWRADVLAHGGPDGGSRVIDGLYHDITGSVLPSACFDQFGPAEHTHEAMGYASFLVDGERAMLDDIAQIADGFGVGVENATEAYIGKTAYSHLGLSGDGPYRPRKPFPDGTRDNPQFAPFDRVVMTGRGRPIPMFEYLAHEYGPVRTGGKVQISEEAGDAWYQVAAYNAVTGGLLELIYFNAPVDVFEDIDPDDVDCPKAWPCAFWSGWHDLSSVGLSTPRGWYGQLSNELRFADEGKIAFLQDAIDLRLRLGQGTLTHGRMVAPPLVEGGPGAVSFDYDFYSSITGVGYEHAGTWDADPIVAAAFLDADDGALSLFVANANDA
ncbi:hypothetical protein KDL45_04080, partial [bacterium]|nr:hypothetical protein [bacterium]